MGTFSNKLSLCSLGSSAAISTFFLFSSPPLLVTSAFAGVVPAPAVPGAAPPEKDELEPPLRGESNPFSMRSLSFSRSFSFSSVFFFSFSSFFFSLAFSPSSFFVRFNEGI